jgi:hypothetical protein
MSASRSRLWVLRRFSGAWFTAAAKRPGAIAVNAPT